MHADPTQAHPGPFIVTTKRPKTRHADRGTVRRAVETLEQAHRAACGDVARTVGLSDAERLALYTVASRITPVGGSVSFLGVTVEIEPVLYDNLKVLSGRRGRLTKPGIIAAFNAKQEATNA